MEGTMESSLQVSHPAYRNGPFDVGLEQSHLVDVLQGSSSFENGSGRAAQDHHG